ncbi:hypothetical protein E2C01_022162 [Portunus trituberculatus]|uniref:Uncharacterized protein n=1 Tax=Portunus trituberculatus TaxID=210409 RepID=A0A5B7E6W1_PORTR|nr:hypothetical protein [Portunus trituberculatus]
MVQYADSSQLCQVTLESSYAGPEILRLPLISSNSDRGCSERFGQHHGDWADSRWWVCLLGHPHPLSRPKAPQSTPSVPSNGCLMHCVASTHPSCPSRLSRSLQLCPCSLTQVVGRVFGSRFALVLFCLCMCCLLAVPRAWPHRSRSALLSVRHKSIPGEASRVTKQVPIDSQVLRSFLNSESSRGPSPPSSPTGGPARPGGLGSLYTSSNVLLRSLINPLLVCKLHTTTTSPKVPSCSVHNHVAVGRLERAPYRSPLFPPSPSSLASPPLRVLKSQCFVGNTKPSSNITTCDCFKGMSAAAANLPYLPTEPQEK